MMQMKPEHSPGRSATPDLQKYKSNAIHAVREAVAAITRYHDAKKQQLSQFAYDFPRGEERDQVKQVVEDELLPLFLGAPGEACEACGGSGRKR